MQTTAPKSFKKGFKYPIYPTVEQEDLLNRTAGCCRHIWNLALSEAKEEYEHYITQKELGVLEPPRPTTSGYDFTAKLPRYKADPEKLWLSEVSSVALQQTLLHLGSAYSRFFKTRKGYPRFKDRRDRQSFTIMTTAFRFKDDQLFIAKSKDAVPVHLTRPMPSDPSSATFSKTPTGRWYVSFICDYTPPKTTGNQCVGIDLGLKDFAVFSTGEKIANPKHLAKREALLKRRQRAFSRKCKGSKNRAKAGHYAAKTHERVANSRRDFLHQLSRRLVNECQVIGMESLNTAGMLKNHHVAKAISDVGWAMFKGFVAYKAIESQHCTLVLMDTFFPSTHLCSSCKTRLDRKLKLSERGWTCPHCGAVHDRDVNAAINIEEEAVAVYAAQQPRRDGAVLASRTRLLS